MPQAGPIRDTVDAVVIGAGVAGLAAADTLVAGGFTVQLIEAAPVVGGIARFLPVGHEEVEAYCHASLAHIYPADRVVSLALNLGRRAGARAGEWLTGTGSEPASRAS